VTEPKDAKQGEQAAEDASWRVDGSQSSPSSSGEGLGDTVVQMSKVPAGKAPTVKPAMGRGKASTVAKADGPRPTIPKPVKQTRTDDLMAAFDQPSAANKSAQPAPSPAPRQSPAPSMAMPKPVTAADLPLTAPPTSVPVAGMVARPAPKQAPGVARRTRKARLRVARVDPWSVMKTVFLFSIAFGIMSWVATYLLWQVLLASGLFAAINDAIVTIISSPNNTEGWRIEDYLSANKVLGVTALLAVINVVITTALGTLGAFLYNLSANILGGLELTLAED
jgi:hypothetical protein